MNGVIGRQGFDDSAHNCAGRSGQTLRRGRSETGLSQRIDVTLGAFALGTVRRRRIRLRSDQARSTQTLKRLAMTKLMMVVVFCMSGALYNPARVLHYVGPDAAAFCWTLKQTLGLR